jgi:type I restriction enzyme R subunit
VAFTGTPLITERHGGKRTVKLFGEYIDTYKLMDAVADGATLQILYEGRTAHTALRDKAEFDAAFEDLFAERTPEELLAIKKKYGATGDILEAENRIAAIARDLVEHYVENILPNGFKAQVVCHSKLAVIRHQRAADSAGGAARGRAGEGRAGHRTDQTHRLPQSGRGRLRRSHQRAG